MSVEYKLAREALERHRRAWTGWLTATTPTEREFWLDALAATWKTLRLSEKNALAAAKKLTAADREAAA